MFKFLKDLMKGKPPVQHTGETAYADFQRRLHIATLHAQNRKTTHVSPDTSVEPLVPANQPVTCEILPSQLADEKIPYSEGTIKQEDELAAALEAILQGAKVDKEQFTVLYRNGYVSKDEAGRWAITATGKLLVERFKILGVAEAGDSIQEECRVSGVPCPKGWTGLNRS